MAEVVERGVEEGSLEEEKVRNMVKIKVRKEGKKLFGMGPKIIPTYKTNYQKNTKYFPGILKFNPDDYSSSNINEQKKMAFHDAKNHRDFYQELINKKIYPKDTKVRVKRIRHSNAYSLEIWMPKVRMLHLLPREDAWNSEVKEKCESIAKKIKSIATEKGYNHKEGFDSDIDVVRNYGVDSQGIKYVDSDILREKLPFEEREKSDLKFTPNKNTLETKVKVVLIGSFLLALFFLSSNITGNVVINLAQNTSNLIGVFLFIVGLVGSYFYFRKYKKFLKFIK